MWGMSEHRKAQVDAAETDIMLYLIAEAGYGYWEFLEFDDGLGMLVNNSNLLKPGVFRFLGEDLLKIHFRVTAKTSLILDGVGQYDLDGAVCQVFYHPRGYADCEWVANGQVTGWVTIYCKKEYVEEQLGFDLESLPNPLFRSLMNKAKPYISHLPLTIAMRNTCNKIIQCDYKSGLRYKFLEGQAIELLSLVLSILQKEANATHSNKLSERDTEAIYEAFSILNDNYVNPPSIKELSQRIGINRSKLTYGFKQMFGVTIHELCHDKRMAEAQRLLLETNERVENIANAVGFDYSNNFSSAFKKMFGVSPKRFRTM